MFILGRELIMDADECEGDARGGMHTIAHFLGPRRTELVGWFVMMLAVIALVVAASGMLSVVMSLIAAAALLVVRLSPPAWRASWSRIPMALGIIVIVSHI
jgi:4-hydroxybenzoate polyprenyltransferase